MRTIATCGECGKEYKYTTWLCKHYDNIHPEIGKSPMEIIACINREWAMKEIEEEANSWIADPELMYSYKEGKLPT